MADIYGAITDSAINRAIKFLMRWRPALFNFVAPSQYPTFDGNGYFTGFGERWLTCSSVKWPPGVDHNTFPRYTRQDPLKMPGVVGGGIPFCAQITDAKIDFHPSNTIDLPVALTPPLMNQRFAVWADVSCGVGCPTDALIDALLNAHFYAHSKFMLTPDLFNQMTLDVQSLICFSLELFATGHLYTQPQPGSSNPSVTEIRVAVNGVEVQNVRPNGLEDAVECYIRMYIRAYVLPKLVLALEPIIVKALGVTFTPTLTSGLPNNPAIEQHELRVWLDVDVTKTKTSGS